MGIPKIIHYCWFGHNPKPELAQRCIASWKKFCPEYEIREWNESNISISECPAYVQNAYREGLWAFVSDYVRLKVVYEHGGIYLDTDVELIKSPDKLLENEAFFGFEDGIHIATGLGFGAVAQLPILKELMDDYWQISFYNEDGTIHYITCPKINTHVFVNHGLLQNNKKQMLEDSVLILPTDYLCPVDYHTDRLKITRNTVAIHWFSKSWMTNASKEEHKKRAKKEKRDYWLHLPNRLLQRLLGDKWYAKIKTLLKRQ